MGNSQIFPTVLFRERKLAQSWRTWQNKGEWEKIELPKYRENCHCEHFILTFFNDGLPILSTNISIREIIEQGIWQQLCSLPNDSGLPTLLWLVVQKMSTENYVRLWGEYKCLEHQGGKSTLGIKTLKLLVKCLLDCWGVLFCFVFTLSLHFNIWSPPISGPLWLLF